MGRVKVPEVRERSANGQPKPRSEFLRACRRCGAGFNELCAAEPELRGLWDDTHGLGWWCSKECRGADVVTAGR